MIFRTHVGKNLANYFQGTVLPPVQAYGLSMWATVIHWSDENGLTPFFLWVRDIVSILVSEAFRGFILFILFLLAGFAFYHLRVARRISYGCIERIFAVIAMMIAINGMAGGDFSAGYIIALLSGLYIMVRGLQNVDDGLRSLADLESANGTARAWHELWQAVFYGPLLYRAWKHDLSASRKLAR